MDHDNQNPSQPDRFARAEQEVEKAWRDAIRASRDEQPRLQVELVDTVAAPGLDPGNWLCMEAGHELHGAALGRHLLAAELRMRGREQLGLDIEDDRGRVHQLRCARGRLN